MYNFASCVMHANPVRMMEEAKGNMDTKLRGQIFELRGIAPFSPLVATLEVVQEASPSPRSIFGEMVEKPRLQGLIYHRTIYSDR